MLKLIYSKKAMKFCEIFTLLLTVCTVVKSKVKISQNFVTFSEYMNFNGCWHISGTPGGTSIVERNLFQSKRPLWNFFVPIVNERLGDAEIFRAFLSWVSCLWEWTFWIKCWHNKLAKFRHTYELVLIYSVWWVRSPNKHVAEKCNEIISVYK